METDFRNNKRRRYKFLGEPEAMLPQEIVLDFNSVKSPFRGIWVILKNLTKFGVDRPFLKISSKLSYFWYQQRLSQLLI